MSSGLIASLWGRRWCRRITYALASGSLVLGAGLWTVRQPFFDHWLVRKLNALAEDQTGLGLEARSLEFQLLQGRIILNDFRLGGDLLQGDRLSVQVDFVSLLGHSPHIWDVTLENPRSVLDAERLARIHLKPRPESGTTPLVRLDRLAISGGDLRIQESAWGLPDAQFTYQVSGKGLGPNRVALDLRVPRILLRTGKTTTEGRFQAQANLSDLALELRSGELQVGRNRLAARGSYALQERVLAASVDGKVDLAELVHLLDPKAPRTWEGVAEFKAEAHGTLADPAWSLTARGQGLKSAAVRLQPGDASLKAEGTLRQATISDLLWTSPEGKVTASGEWKKGAGSRMSFRCEQVGLAPLAALSRSKFLQGVTAELTGQAEMPGDPWVPPQLDEVSLQAEGTFFRQGETVGRLALDLSHGQLALDQVSLHVPEISTEGSATLRLGKNRLLSVSATATAETDAALVAEVLHAWDIGEGHDAAGKTIPLGMGGKATAKAELEWSPTLGVQMKGLAEVLEPRWHGATMDRLRAEVSIEGDELRVENIEGEKGSGGARGSLWLTWRDLPAGQDQIDMCYQAFRLPIEEGLKAGDVGDLPITGTGSGWARIHGPYDHLRIEASAMAEGASVYGFRIPYASGDMDYDITGDRLVIRDARVAEQPGLLGTPEEAPSGPLALQGGMDMDLKRDTWEVFAKGNVDSEALGLPGPRFQGRVDARFEGPWTRSFGPLELPVGEFSFRNGRTFLGQQSLEGLTGRLDTREGALQLTLGSEGKPSPFFTLNAWPEGKALAGSLAVHIATESADTALLARRLTGDLLRDGQLDLAAEGRWDGSALRWQGRMDRLAGYFDGFILEQRQPTLLKGDASGLNLDLVLDGKGMNEGASAAQVAVSGHVPFSPASDLALKIQGEAELANLKGILDHLLDVDEYSLMSELKPEGQARFDLRVGGPYTLPTMDGLLSLTNGSLRVRTFPQSIEDLSFNLHLKGRDAALLESDPLQGRIAQGALKAWGQATWEFGGISSYDFHSQVDDFQLRDVPEGFELYGSLDAELKGDKDKGGLLTGTLKARRLAYQAEINLRDLILASATGGTPLLRYTDPNDPLTRIGLDLDLILLQPWEFDTNLLQLQGRPVGAFKVQGSLAEPGLKGKMDILPGGRLPNLLPAGDVVLERGTIEWTNPQVWFPNVDLQGRVDVSPYVVYLAIRGGLDGMDMKVTSSPSLRQDEITAILVDPSLAPNIGALSGPTSQSSLNYGWASTGSGLLTTLALANFQESLRRTLKLDRVNVAWRAGTGTASSETSVTVGKNIDLFGHRTPLVVTHQKSGDVTTISGQVEWRFGDLVLSLGVSQTGSDSAAPSGEIRRTWRPGW